MPPRWARTWVRFGRRCVDPVAFVGFAAVGTAWYIMSPRLGPLRLPSIEETYYGIVDHFLSSSVISAQGGGSSGMLPHLAATTTRTLIGVAIGGLLGIAAGLAAANSEIFRTLVRPPLEVLRVTPSLVAAPFLILWFGISDLAQIGLVAFYTLLVLQVNAFNAVTNLPPQYENFAATLGAKRWRILRTVTIPGIIPELIGGLRVALQLAWGLAIVSEVIGAQRGMGRMMESMRQIFRFDLIFAGIVITAMTAVIIDLILKGVLYRVTRWQASLGEGRAAQA